PCVSAPDKATRRGPVPRTGSRDKPERERVLDADVVTTLDDLDRSPCADVLSRAAGDCNELARRWCADVLAGDHSAGKCEDQRASELRWAKVGDRARLGVVAH